MRALSGQFRDQARADLGLAMLISSSDQSGHALGEAMFLAQQCFEKQLKAIVLMLNEIVGFEDGDNFLRRMSHAFFPKLQKFYGECVGKLPLPKPLESLARRKAWEAPFEHHARFIEHINGFWAQYSNPELPWSMLLWKNTMGIELQPVELVALNGFFHRDLISVAHAVGHASPHLLPERQFFNEFDPYPDMRAALHDNDKMTDLRVRHMHEPGNSEIQHYKHMQLSKQHATFSTALDLVDTLPARQQEQGLRRLVSGFGFETICLQAYKYIRWFPHNTLGRYPTGLDGSQTTADVYGQQADRVLYKIHVVARHDFELFSEQAAALEEICGLGRARGHW